MMSLRFVIGRSGSGKTTFLLEEMKERLLSDPAGNPLIYIVPDQMTFLSEYKLLKDPDIKGLMRLNVYSFNRLALRILQETGGISRIPIDSTGIQMLIKKVIAEQKQNLRVYRQAADKFGFLAHVESTLSELKRYTVHPDELAFYREQDDLPQSLKDKLHDIELIFRVVDKYLHQRYLATEDTLALLLEKIPEADYLRNAEIYIDGFYDFTPLEYSIIAGLLKVSPRVTIALTVDRPYREHAPDPLNLFATPGGTYSTIHEIAVTGGIPVEDDVILDAGKRFSHPSLSHLETAFAEMPVIPYPADSQIAIAEAANPRAEIQGIGRKIISFVRDHGYRFRDIAILVRNGETYFDLFETIFTDMNIPFYVDKKRSMLNHPLIELLRSSLETITSYWRRDPVFRAVKTDLLFPLDGSLPQLREQMDRLENYCLAYGIQGDRWLTREKWRYRRFRGLEMDFPQTDQEKELERELNESRELIRTPLMLLAKRLQKATNIRKMCVALFTFLEELEIPAKLERMRTKAEEEGNLLLSRDHEQAWDAVLDLLDQLVEILGEEQVSVKQFADLIEAGVESLYFSNIPPAIDQVVIADMELSRLSDVKIAFVIGVNDGVLPKKFVDEGIFSDEDREVLQTTGLTLAPTTDKRLLDEEFIAYKTMTIPQDYLFISYPLATEEGEAQLPSPYVKRIKDMFPRHQTYRFENDPHELETKEQLEFLVNPREALTYVTAELQRFKRQEPIDPIWWDAYNLLISGDNKEHVERVLTSLFFENKAVPLRPETVNELYGEVLQGSISRMELFNSCAYQHFLQHGLRLRDREVYRLDAPNIGDLFHGALKFIGERIKSLNLSWGNLSDAEITRLVREAMVELTPRLQNEILLSSHRYQYLKQKLEKIIYRSTKVMSEHARMSGFSPVGLEVVFGPHGDLPPVNFRLKNGTNMQLVGRIDRVDEARTDQGIYLRVVDYKSSNQQLNLTEVYYGLALQMLTYLDILIRYSEQLIGEEATPAGVLYFHVHNPLVRSDKPLSDDEIESRIFKEFKMNGLVVSDPDVVRLMDQSLDTGWSQIISAGITRSGQLYKNSQAASKEDFTSLRKYVNRVFEKTGNEIIAGNNAINPYKLNDETSCRFCPFHSICQFDPALKENNYRILPSLKKDEALQMIKEAVQE